MPTAPDPSPEYDATAEPPPYPTPAHPSIQRPRNLQLPPQGRTSVNLNFTEDNTSTEPRSRRHYLIPCVCFWPFLLTGIGVGAWLLHLQNMTSPHCTPPVNLVDTSCPPTHQDFHLILNTELNVINNTAHRARTSPRRSTFLPKLPPWSRLLDTSPDRR
jgi:hypothetical protein